MTRRFVLGAAGAIAMIAPAYAADLGTGGMKDMPPPPFSWAGWYIGVNGGYAFGTGSNLFADDNLRCDYESDQTCGDHHAKGDLTPQGGFGGGQVGFNWQHDRVVYGFETDFQGAGITGSARAVPINTTSGFGWANAETELDWFGTVRGRLGLTIFNQGLVYITGGFAYGGVQDRVTETIFGTSRTLSRDQVATGYTLGGGFEYAWSPAWSIKAEGLYMDIGKSIDLAFDPNHSCTSVSERSVQSYAIARVGVNYHFIPAYEPLK